MWLAKFRNWHRNCLIRPRCVKYKVSDAVFLLSCWIEKNKFYYTEFHVLQGRHDDVRKFIKDFRKDKGIKKFEVEGNHIMTLNEESSEKEYYSPVFDRRIVYIKPVMQRADGYEDWEVASWNRDILMSLMKVPAFDMKLISIQQVKIDNLFMPQIYPRLSPKQKDAIELAVKNEYYNFPRKVYLEKLAKISKVSRTTYEENLRKAENKIIPFLTESIIAEK